MAKKSKEPETEDQKAERLAREAKEAEETVRRQDEEGRLALREKEMRERQYGKANEAKILTHWTKVMRQAKVEELRKEVEVLSQQHEREIDRKDALLQLLDRDLNDAEEQYLMAFRGHSDSVKALLDLQYVRVRGLMEAYMQTSREMEAEFATERQDIVAAHARHKKDFQDVLEAMQKEFQDAENDARQEFEGAREEIRTRTSEEYTMTKISLDSQIENLESHFDQAHQAYMASTEARTNAFRQLTKNDASAAKKIEKGMKKLVRLQELLAHWRNKIASNSKEWEERNKALRQEKELMQRHYKSLKTQLDHFRSQQTDKLKQLAKSAGECSSALVDKIRVAERILKLAEMCRRLETEQEKVTPFYTSAAALAEEVMRIEQEEKEARGVSEPGAEGSQAAPEREGSGSSLRVEAEDDEDEDGEGAGPSASATLQPRSLNEPGDPALHTRGVAEDGAEVDEWRYLDQFFRRMNKALLERTALASERQRLESENSELKSILKQYLDGLSITQEVVADPANPLLIVNGRLQKTLVQRQTMAAQASRQLVEVQVAPSGAGGGHRA